MSQRRAVAFAAAGGTLLATAPLSTVFQDWTWVVYAVLVIAAVSGAGMAARALRAQPWVQLLAMLAALLVMLTWLAHGPGAIAGTIPTRSTFVAFGRLLGDAGADIRRSGLPVPGNPGLLFLVALGIGLVMVLVDMIAVPLRRPAIAGFPMLAIYAVPVFVHQDSVAPLPFAVGAAGFLWLLGSDSVERVRRFGRRFTGEGRGVDVWEPSPLAAAGRRLALFGVVLAIALPVAIPGMTVGFFDRFDTGGDGIGPGNGRGNSVNLFATLEGQLHQDKAFEMVKVTTNDPAPYYLRFATADQLTPTGFKTRPLGANDTVTKGGIPDPTVDLTGVSQRIYHATVTAVDFDMRYAPVYQVLSSTQKLDDTWLYDSVGDQVYSLRSSVKGRTYSFDYAATTYDPAALRKAPTLDPANAVQEFTKVGQQRDEVVTLVNHLIAGKTNDYDRVMAIYTYFTVANHFQYSLSTKPGTSGSDIVDFLKNKRGYCEQYAAAMAWMVRTANIPARVAFGFTRGSRNGSAYTLTNLNLHAWTEVYFSGFGWIPFDATPTLPGTVTSNWAPDPNRPLTAPSSSTGVDGTNPSGGPDGGALGAPHKNGTDRGSDTGTLTPGEAGRTWYWWAGGAGALVLFLLLVPAVRRASLRRTRLRRRAGTAAERVAVDGDTGPPGEMHIVASPAVVIREAHAAWAEFVDTLVDYGFPPDRARTPRETVRVLAQELRIGGSTADSLRLLAQAEERARYARTPMDAGDLGAALRAIRSAVRARASRRTRLRAAILPPSVMQRWSYRMGTASAALVSELGRRWERAVRLLSPRRLLPGRTER